jgi:hypothetical protein
MAETAALLVDEVLPEHLIKKAGFSRTSAQTGAVTLIQRFGSALKSNIHLHMLFLNGVDVERPDGSVPGTAGRAGA